jgi:LacI family transcriptional regulator
MWWYCPICLPKTIYPLLQKDTFLFLKVTFRKKGIAKRCRILVYESAIKNKGGIYTEQMIQKATIYDIAEKANVSISTVSRVFNGSSAVSKKTKKKVEKAIKELDYIPNALARSLVNRLSNTIGVIVSDLTNPFFTDVIDGIEKYLNSQGFTTFLSNTRYNVEKENLYISQLIEKRVDGLIVFNTCSEENSIIERVKKIIPVVSVQSSLKETDCVNTTDELGAYNAVDYLIKQGHTKIAFLVYKFQNSTINNRLKGYYKAHKDNRLAINKNYIISSDFTPYCGYYMTNEILDKMPEVTAIFTYNDQLAVSAYYAIQMRGLKIPDDISIIGYDNIELASLIRPTLTTIEQPMYEMGKSAAELVLSRIRDDRKSTSQTILMPTKLVIRDSVKKI